MSNTAYVPIKLLQQRDFGDTISTGFQFIRQNWKGLYVPILLLAVPLHVIGAFFFGSFFDAIQTMQVTGEVATAMSGMLAMAVGYGAMILAYMVMMTVVYEYMRHYLLSNGTPPERNAFLKQIGLKVWSYLGYSIVIGIAIILVVAFAVVLVDLISGLVMMLFVPVIFWLMFVWSFSLPLYAFERASVGTCIVRPFRLVAGNWWKTFGIVFLLSLMAVMVSYAVALPFMMIWGFSIFSGMGAADPAQASAGMGSLMTVYMLVIGVVGSLAQVFVLVPLGVHVLSTIEQKESRGLMQQVEDLNVQG